MGILLFNGYDWFCIEVIEAVHGFLKMWTDVNKDFDE